MPPAIRDFFWQFQHLANTGQLVQMLITAGIILVVLVILLRLIMAAVGTIGQIGLINGTWQLEEGAQKISFGALIKDGWKDFWKIILFKLLLIGVGIALALAVIILTVVTLFCGLIVIIPALFVYSFVYWIVVEYILAALVGDSMGIFDAIAKSWTVFKQNWITSAIMGLLVGVIEVVFGIIMAIPLLLIMIPGGIGVFTAITTHSDTGLVPGLAVSGVLLLIYIPIAIFLGGVKVAFLEVNWILVYRALTGRGPRDEAAPAVEAKAGEVPSDGLG